MTLVDTSIWIDHIRARDDRLVTLLQDGQVLTHPFVIGEIALGSLRQRRVVLDLLSNLPRAKTATADEALHFIDEHTLAGTGVGYVDAHLLAAIRLTAGAILWTRDKTLKRIADRIGVIAV